MKTLCFVLLALPLWAQQPSSDHQKVLAQFEAWQVQQRQIGRIAEDSCCSAEALLNKTGCEGSSIIGLPKDYTLYFSDFNGDKRIDGLVTLNPFQCDGGKLLRNEEDWIFILSEGEVYKIQDDYKGKIQQKVPAGNYLFLDRVSGSTLLGEMVRYAPEDPLCCPSIKERFVITFREQALRIVED